jgi:hypothetical protein
MMSTAALSEAVDERLTPPSLSVVPQKPAASDQGTIDPHPLLPVFIAGFIALAISSVMIGSILLWLAFRDSGVLAP